MKNFLPVFALAGTAVFGVACGGEEAPSLWPAQGTYELNAQFHVKHHPESEGNQPLPTFRVDEKFTMGIEPHGDKKPFVIWDGTYVQPISTNYRRQNEDMLVGFLGDFVVTPGAGECHISVGWDPVSFAVELHLEEDGTVHGIAQDLSYVCNPPETLVLSWEFTGRRVE